MIRHSLIATLAALTAATAVAPAVADGGPAPGIVSGGAGVATPDGGKRYVALPAPGGTVLAVVDTKTGSIDRFRSLTGLLGVPVVAFDGTTGGVSADGRTLVLAGIPDGRPVSTRFVILDTRTLRTRHAFTLRGRFEFDALAPDATTLYLIEHLSVRTPRYLVRAYDVEDARLVPEVVRDAREKERAMHGYPVARATSADGRWVFTLYVQTDVHSFVHALDTVRRRAICIDLPGGRRSLNAAALELAADGTELVATTDAGDAVAVIDTRTMRARSPSYRGELHGRGASAEADAAAAVSRRHGEAMPWAPLGAVVAAVGIVVGLARRPRHRGRASS